MGPRGWNKRLNETHEERPVLTGVLAGFLVLPLLLALAAGLLGADRPLTTAIAGSVLVAIVTIAGGLIRRQMKDETAALAERRPNDTNRPGRSR